jgi:Domain of unknown function (DUF4430)
MTAGRSAVAATMLCIASAATGCGLGPGPSSSGDVSLIVTRDYGSTTILEAAEADPPESETVIRLLDREAEITTRYGGGFVEAIDGVSGELADGRSSDWFFYVNGIESPRGGADVGVRGGDRIWWDYRDWTAAMRVPAVVGSWPEPFAQASADQPLAVEVECFGARPPCEQAAKRLADAGVDAQIADPAAAGDPSGELRLLVGPWARVRSDPAAAALDDGPAASAVFARFERTAAGWEAVALDQSAAPAERLQGSAGLVAALRRGDDPPTWIATGTDAAAVDRAVGLLDRESLADHYAVISAPEATIPVPTQAGG